MEKQNSGKTVLDIMRRVLGISMGTVKKLKFLERGIVLNGERVTVRAVVKEGDILILETEDTQAQEGLEPVDLPLDIVYEDEGFVIPSKPADMPTHPSHDHHYDTVANALAYRYGQMGIPFVFRPVNRLDRNTSGLLLVARDRLTACTLSDALRGGKIKKSYIAVLDGIPARSEGVIDTYMRRTADSIIVRENCAEGEGGDRAITRYKVLCAENGHSIVLAEPVTGRTHQLRVHFSGIGCAIVGDDLYGRASDLIARHALHSYSLTLPHPKTEEIFTVNAPIPPDMEELIRSLFSSPPIF